MAAKSHEEFCAQHHLITTGNCHMVAECEECLEIWNAATEAAVAQSASSECERKDCTHHPANSPCFECGPQNDHMNYTE